MPTTIERIPHLVLIEPVEDDQTNALIIDALRERYVQSGWIIAVSETLEEDLSVGDFVVFVGWQQYGIPSRAYAPWKEHLYLLHEDDIELVVEDW